VIVKNLPRRARVQFIEQNPKYCAVCDTQIPSSRYFLNTKFCSSVCSGLVARARGAIVAPAIEREIRKGRIKRPQEFSCADCGRDAEVYDHREYLKPLSVDPVCKKCNFRRGSAVDVKELVARFMKVNMDDVSIEAQKLNKKIQEWRTSVGLAA
jgi:hypothetical protein